MVSLERVRDELRSMFWLVPAACVVTAIGAAVGLIALDQVLGVVSPGVLFPGPPSGARSFLSSITQAMIAFTGLVFSITIVVLQLTSGQFSPRVLRAFLRDRAIQFALGVFISTFVYAMVVQRGVTGSAGHRPFVPRIAVTGAFVLVLASVGLFIFYIHHVANMIRVATIVATLGAESRDLLRCRYPASQPAAGPLPDLGPAVRVIAAPRPGVLVSVNEKALAGLAERIGCVVVLAARVGDYLPEGAPLLRIHTSPTGGGSAGNVPGTDEPRLLAEVAQDTERTMEQDLAFGFRQLVDIAERALSPAVNDPTTACQALDVLHDLLRRLAVRHLPSGRLHGADGSLRVIVPQYGFADFVDLAVQEIWRYGSDAAQVPGRLSAMLADLSAAALPEYLPVLQQWADRIDGSAAGGQQGGCSSAGRSGDAARLLSLVQEAVVRSAKPLSVWARPRRSLLEASCRLRLSLAGHRVRTEEGRPIQPTREDFENLLSFRVALRRFQHWSEDQASGVGLTHVQHQLLVAIKGHPGRLPPAVGEIADYLLLQSHSVVGLVDRAELAGFVHRRPDADDARVVRVELTEKGDRLVTELTEAHLVELYKLAEALNHLLPEWWTH